MRRQVFHTWGQTAYLSVCFGIFLLIAVGMFADGEMLTQRDYFGIVLYSLIGAGSLFLLWRAFRLGIAVDASGVEIRALGRGHRIPWANIVDVSCENYELRFGVLPLYAPVLKVSSGADYESVPLTPVGSYQRSVAERRTQWLLGQLPVDHVRNK